MARAAGVLVLPDSTELPVTGKKVIGRVDLAKYASPAEVGWVSRQHFTIFEENGAFYIQDDKSTNGTKLDGVEIKQQGKHQLKDGSEILAGDAVKLMFKIKQ
jgi:predicted component of type VI protein secretion system